MSIMKVGCLWKLLCKFMAFDTGVQISVQKKTVSKLSY